MIQIGPYATRTICFKYNSSPLFFNSIGETLASFSSKVVLKDGDCTSYTICISVVFLLILLSLNIDIHCYMKSINTLYSIAKLFTSHLMSWGPKKYMFFCLFIAFIFLLSLKDGQKKVLGDRAA